MLNIMLHICIVGLDSVFISMKFSFIKKVVMDAFAPGEKTGFQSGNAK